MKNVLGLAAATLVLSLGLASPSTAGVTDHFRIANAPEMCQAFTPGVSNTIRNRVTGAENVGAAPIAVACSFASQYNGAGSNSNLNSVMIFFSNNTAAPMTINCTMLTGAGTNAVSGGAAYASAKTITIAANSPNVLQWNAADNPAPGATDFGNYMVGVNCTLPPGAIMNATQVDWSADNGIGT